MSDVLAYVAAVLMLTGAVFSLLAAIGLLRLPDLYTRLHAASKAGVVGAGLVFAAIVFAAADGGVALRAVFGILFLLLTTPVAAHLLARAAYLSGVRHTPGTQTTDVETIRKNNP